METIQLLGSTVGLGLVSGLNLYATVCTVGLGIRLGLITLRPELHELEVLADTLVIVVAGVVSLVEFLADKIKWVDTIWDAVHTLIRPVGAVILSATVLGRPTPVTLSIALLCGGVAPSGHSAKAGLRLLVNHSPEPISNVVLSLIENVLVVAGAWLAVEHPVVMLVIAGVFIALFCWFAPRIARLIRIEILAVYAIVFKVLSILKRHAIKLRRRFARWKGATSEPDDADIRTYFDAEIESDDLPVRYRYFVKDQLHLYQQQPVIKCVAGKGVRRLRHSVGYLFLTSEELIFVSRRLFQIRAERISRCSIDDVHFKKGFLMDRLNLRVAKQHRIFLMFKDADQRAEVICRMLNRGLEPDFEGAASVPREPAQLAPALK